MAETAAPNSAANITPPIVVDIGKVSRKKIRRLKKGQGPLLDDVNEAVLQVQEQLGRESNGKEIVPVVILYRKEPKKLSKCFPSFLA